MTKVTAIKLVILLWLVAIAIGIKANALLKNYYFNSATDLMIGESILSLYFIYVLYKIIKS